MVLEQLFPQKWVEHRLKYLFLITIVYTALAIFVSTLIFPKNSGLVSIILSSLLLIPYIKKAIREDERKTLHERKLNFWHLWNDNKESIKVYLTIFLGIYFSYMFFSYILASYGLQITSIFREQLALETNLRGQAYTSNLFLQIITNNWWVLLVCFLFGLLVGDAALFFITWNASSWATIFTFRAFEAAGSGYGEPWMNLLLIFLITLPHLLLEGLAYIIASVAGSEMSYDVIRKKKLIKNFSIAFIVIILLTIIVYGLLFKLFTPNIARLIGLIFSVLLLYLLSYLFETKKESEAFKYAYYLFIFATIIFFLGAIIEILVLTNIGLLGNIYQAAKGVAIPK